ncbi:MAG: hypothetical protein Q4A05_00685 [Ruminococcus sp.]|nr:hypothetical protein [Ruminococcus sp.]
MNTTRVEVVGIKLRNFISFLRSILDCKRYFVRPDSGEVVFIPENSHDKKLVPDADTEKDNA